MFLLPGFVTASIFYSFTSHPKPSSFERVIQALVFTVLVYALVELARLCGRTIHSTLVNSDTILSYWSYGNYFVVVETLGLFKALPDIILNVLFATLLGFVSVYITNSDIMHRFLRDNGITLENSHPSEWYSAFARYKTYVVLHLTGQRRLYGWPQEWSNDPANGHIVIVDGEWLNEVSDTPIESAETILIPVTEVEMVEFVQMTEQTQE